MKIMYRTGSWGLESIVKVEIEKETEKCVWVNGRRSAKRSEFEQYHNTWKEAHAYLMVIAEGKLNSARLALERAQGNYGNIKGLKEF